VILSADAASHTSAGRDTEIEFFRRQHGRCIAKFRGIDSISEAEKHIGNQVLISPESLPAPKEGWFYTFQLKGCQVFTTTGEYIGTVTDVVGVGGTDILKVDRDKEETLIPFAQQYLKSIDPDQHRIEVDLPEDLRDLNK
jgi:16S rRNA processing protein RimM